MKVKEPINGVYEIDGFGPRVKAAFSGRYFTNHRHDAFLRALELEPKNMVLVNQVHGDVLHTVKRDAIPHGRPEGDGLITGEPGLILGIMTADCCPVFFYDSEKNVIGLIHAGWRGVKGQIIAKAIQHLTDQHQSKVDNLQMALGPMIHACCYRVGPEFRAYFPHDYFERSAGEGYLDLSKDIKRQARKAGLLEKQIYDAGICSSCRNDEFYSYRQNSQTAERTLSVITLI